MASTGKQNWLKKILIIGGILLVIGGGIIWYLFTLKFEDTATQKSDFSVKATDFIKEFETADSVANAKYKDKIVSVNGTVSEVEAADTTVNLKMTDTTSGSYIIFSFQQQHMADAKKIKQGENVTIKGSFSAGVYSSILESETITFQRCAVQK